jgi:hypothetical protein
VWRVYLCALLLVLNHAILKTKARAEEGERWAHPLGGLSWGAQLDLPRPIRNSSYGPRQSRSPLVARRHTFALFSL